MNRMFKGSLIVSLILFLAIGLVIVNDLRYPSEWDQIHLGMSRTDVENLLGPDPGEMKGLGMADWDDGGILIRSQLQAYIDAKEGVTIISIQRFSIIPIVSPL